MRKGMGCMGKGYKEGGVWGIWKEVYGKGVYRERGIWGRGRGI